MAVAPLAFNKAGTLPYVGGAAAMDIKVPDSEQYGIHVLQFAGFTAGTKFNVLGSLDGVTYSRMDATCFSLVDPDHVTASAAGTILHLYINVAFKGGIKIVQTAPSAAAGAVHFAMSGNAYRGGRD